MELAPGPARLRVSPRWLPLGGLISGFFGGLLLVVGFALATGLA